MPAAEQKVNGHAVGGQMWNFWAVGRDKCYLLAGQHRPDIFNSEEAFEATGGLRVVPSFGSQGMVTGNPELSCSLKSVTPNVFCLGHKG